MLTAADIERRSDAALLAFLEPEEAAIGGMVLRPITLGSLSLLRITKNEFLFPRGPVQDVMHPVTGEIVRMAVPDDELFAALAFAYIHAAPLEEVRTAAFSAEFFRERVIELGERLSLAMIPWLQAEIQRRLEQIKTLQFGIKAKPKDGPDHGPAAPPN